MALVVKNLPANVLDMGSIPSLERSPEGGNGSPLQEACLENSTDLGGLQSIGSQTDMTEYRVHK